MSRPWNVRRHRLQHVRGIRDLYGLGHAAGRLCGRHQQTVVRPDEEPAVPGAKGERAPLRAHARIDNGHVHAHRQEAASRRPARGPRAPPTAGSMPWVRWITRASGHRRRMTPSQMPTYWSASPKSERKLTTGAAIAVTVSGRRRARRPPARRRRAASASATGSTPAARSDALVTGPIETARSRAAASRVEAPSTVSTVDEEANVTRSAGVDRLGVDRLRAPCGRGAAPRPSRRAGAARRGARPARPPRWPSASAGRRRSPSSSSSSSEVARGGTTSARDAATRKRGNRGARRSPRPGRPPVRGHRPPAAAQHR